MSTESKSLGEGTSAGWVKWLVVTVVLAGASTLFTFFAHIAKENTSHTATAIRIIKFLIPIVNLINLQLHCEQIAAKAVIN